ncbi:hypothetical protein CCR75_002284 [Bremia lactucae]|uniref:RxLR effector protein n=1 Tax=Bremia lactucae TaxID=4779 RepID=A0A976FLU5_BRELC|nr:hypothetical protein CCR75_002284 [Bremia lactucae]
MRFAFSCLVVLIAASVVASKTTDFTRKALATDEASTILVPKFSAQRRRLKGSLYKVIVGVGSKVLTNPKVQKFIDLYRRLKKPKRATTATFMPNAKPAATATFKPVF